MTRRTLASPWRAFSRIGQFDASGSRLPAAVIDRPAALLDPGQATVGSELHLRRTMFGCGTQAPHPARQCRHRDFPARRLAQQSGRIRADARATLQPFQLRTVLVAAEPPALPGDRGAQRYRISGPHPATSRCGHCRHRDHSTTRRGLAATTAPSSANPVSRCAWCASGEPVIGGSASRTGPATQADNNAAHDMAMEMRSGFMRRLRPTPGDQGTRSGMSLGLIWAQWPPGVIGRAGGIPWRLPRTWPASRS